MPETVNQEEQALSDKEKAAIADEEKAIKRETEYHSIQVIGKIPLAYR